MVLGCRGKNHTTPKMYKRQAHTRPVENFGGERTQEKPSEQGPPQNDLPKRPCWASITYITLTLSYLGGLNLKKLYCCRPTCNVLINNILRI